MNCMNPSLKNLKVLSERETEHHTDSTNVRFPFKRNRLRCVRCVNENRKKRKRFTQQTQAPANRNARSKQWKP